MNADFKWLQAADSQLFGQVREAMNKIDVAYVATYPPRECGVATFTRDLSSQKTSSAVLEELIVAMSHGDRLRQYPREVRSRSSTAAWTASAGADFINESSASLVSLQHEYGIFGGPDGEYILDFAERLCKPIVVTLHTVLFNPTPNQKRIIQRLGELASSFVVMVELGREILTDVYGIPPEKIALIPHGVPNVHRIPADLVKRDLGISGHEVVSTFGLISRGKGIEYGIRAIAEVKKRFPNVLYLVLGETHPGVRNHEGESYRQMLQGLLDELDLHDNVRFNNRFLTLRELVRYLSATDAYVTPYVNRDQIVSGTLAYAVGCGRAIVSTRYLSAEEILSEGRGVLVDFRDPEASGESSDPVLRGIQKAEPQRTNTAEELPGQRGGGLSGAVQQSAELDRSRAAGVAGPGRLKQAHQRPDTEGQGRQPSLRGVRTPWAGSLPTAVDASIRRFTGEHT